MKKRIEYIDIAKSIGIILVVLGHTDFAFKNFLYQFHLPLFYFLSGLVFSEKYLSNNVDFIKKRFISLYVPFVKFELLFLIFHNFFSYIGFYNYLSNIQLYYSSSEIIKNCLKILTMGYGEQLAGPLWFLISLLEINIIFFFLLKISLKISKKKSNILLFIFGIILYFVGCFTNFPRLISKSFIGLLFFIFGFIYKKYNEKIKFKIYFFIVCIAILIICSSLNIVDISMLIIEYKSLLIISGLAGTYITLYLSKIFSFLNNKFILYIGKNTIYILAFHCLAFKVIMLVEIYLNKMDYSYIGYFPCYQINQIWGIVLTIGGIIIPLTIIFLKDKIKESMG